VLLIVFAVALAAPAAVFAQPPRPGPNWIWTNDGWVPPDHPLAFPCVPIPVLASAVGTRLWTQGATILDPTTGLPVHTPPEMVGMPIIMRLGAGGGVIDLCGTLHPQRRGSITEIPTPLGPIPFTELANASEGPERWEMVGGTVVANWRKHLYDETEKVMEYAAVILELTTLTTDSFEGFTQVGLFQPDGQPLFLPIVVGMHPVPGFAGPSKGVRMPLLRLRGEIAWREGEPDETVGNWFERSLPVADEQQARAWLLRTRTSLAGWRQARGDTRDAGGHLADLVGG
jgi:hypothetical protein